MATDTIERTTTDQITPTEHTRSVRHYAPNVDIVERGDELTVYADMPGTTADDIDINFENGTLTIHGKATQRQGDDTNYVLCEYGIGDFYRTFRVSEVIDSQRISAECTDGVLVLHLPKVDAIKPRRIEVSAG